MKAIDNRGVKFVCDSELDAWRAKSLFTKEPGTIAWLDRVLMPWSVFYDIGANVGCYALYAASKLSDAGHVYAFEPHPATRMTLLRNVVENRLAHRVTPLAIPLSYRTAPSWLQYGALESGASNNQLRGTPTGVGEFVMTATLDDLLMPLYGDGLAFPSLIKMDVDGCELEILYGAKELIRSHRVRSWQVEVAPADRQQIIEWFAKVDHRLIQMHFTALGMKALASGQPSEELPVNCIFEPDGVLA